MRSSSSAGLSTWQHKVPTRRTLDVRSLCSVPPRRVDWNNQVYNQVSQFVIPPIPTTERRKRRNNNDDKSCTAAAAAASIADQARWIWTELAYGFRYMARVYVWLQLGSFACTALRTRLLDGAIMTIMMDKNNKVLLATSIGPLHLIENWFKLHILRTTKASFLFKSCIVSPIVEELTYRGLGHVLGRLVYHISVLMLAWVASFGVTTARLYVTSMCLDPLWMIVSLVRLPFLYLGGWLKWCANLAHLCVLAPMAWKLLELAHGRNDKEDASEESTRDTIHVASEHVTHATPDVESRDNWVSQKAYSIVSKKANVELPPDFQAAMQKWSTLSARLYGATGFGLAHFDTGVNSWATSLQSLQKCVGTFCSSMLVESRLVCQRGNLWSAMGAHVAFNVLGVVMAVLRAIRVSVYKIN